MNARDFLGGGWKFPLEIDAKTGHFSMSLHEDNIRESVEIILRTYVGERVMRPDFGSHTMDYVFSSDKDFPAQSLRADLERELTLQEPRITDVQVTSDADTRTTGELRVNISYTVRSTNNRYSKVYPFYQRHDLQED